MGRAVDGRHVRAGEDAPAPGQGIARGGGGNGGLDGADAFAKVPARTEAAAQFFQGRSALPSPAGLPWTGST